MDANSVNSTAFLHIVIGGTGSGKTTFVKKSYKKFNPLVYDVNNEYKDFPNSFFGNIDVFLDNVKKTKNRVVIVEESTIHFSTIGGRPAQLLEMLVRKRHQNNNYILVFHSMRSVPVVLFDFADFVTVFKTKDRPTSLNKLKDTTALDVFFEVQKMEDPHGQITFKNI